MHEDPFLHGWDVGDDCHARAGNVFIVGYVVDDRAPVLQILGGLMGEFLAVEWVALVGVVGYQLALILPGVVMLATNVWRRADKVITVGRVPIWELPHL